VLLFCFQKRKTRSVHWTHRPRLAAKPTAHFAMPFFTLIPFLFQGHDIFEVKSGLIRKISVNAFDFRIIVEGVFIEVKQREAARSEPVNVRPSRAKPGLSTSQSSFNENEAQGIWWSGINEGIKQILGLGEQLKKKIQLEVRDIVVELKLAEGQLLTVKLNTIAMKHGDGAENELNTACDAAKVGIFFGLAVQLVQLSSSSTSNPSNTVLASISWGTTGCGGKILVGGAVDELQRPIVDINASLNGVCVWLSPAAMPVIMNLAEPISRIKGQHSETPFTKNMPASENSLTRSMMVAEVASSSTFMRALNVPDGERLLEEELSHLPGAHGGEEVRNFYFVFHLQCWF
jgi:hypothetical protein